MAMQGMSHALSPGSLFADRYRVVRCIAAGGMGAVYEVIHLETERRRALKVLLPELLQADDLRERFKREAKIAAHIDSEHIVDIFDAGVDDATRMPFLVMELLKGEELGKRLKRLGRFPPAEVVTFLQQTALALDKTHGASIVHRDLKPANLFLTEREDGAPRIKVLDFGIAKLVVEGVAGSGATQSLGTPFYMAPEQFKMDARLSPATDIHALGMIAYTLLVGVPYWREEARRGGNVFAFSAVALLGPQEPPCERAARAGVTLPPAFDGWFATATARLPEQRFSSATGAIAALAQVLDVPAGLGPGLVKLAMPEAPVTAIVSAEPEPSSAPLLPQSLLVTAVTESAHEIRQETPLPRRRSALVVQAVLAACVLALGGGLLYEMRSSSRAVTGAGESTSGASPTLGATGAPPVSPPGPTASAEPASPPAVSTSASAKGTEKPPSPPRPKVIRPPPGLSSAEAPPQAVPYSRQ